MILCSSSAQKSLNYKADTILANLHHNFDGVPGWGSGVTRLMVVVWLLAVLSVIVGQAYVPELLHNLRQLHSPRAEVQLIK